MPLVRPLRGTSAAGTSPPGPFGVGGVPRPVGVDGRALGAEGTAASVGGGVKARGGRGDLTLGHEEQGMAGALKPVEEWRAHSRRGQGTERKGGDVCGMS